MIVLFVLPLLLFDASDLLIVGGGEGRVLDGVVAAAKADIIIIRINKLNSSNCNC